ncbi:calcitonin receptor-like isoform X3 [Gordionus sp. m RMFG-2023]|uniref:calcitonin receptor-like isoform X3 n=1 Tax=Gordionus sp. m RMFG-2023 TaxID=3053472 RepID=UPI0031FD9424
MLFLLWLIFNLNLLLLVDRVISATLIPYTSINNNISRSIYYCRYTGGYLPILLYLNTSCAQCFAFIFPDHDLRLYEHWLVHKLDLPKLTLDPHSISKKNMVQGRFDITNHNSARDHMIQINSDIKFYDPDFENLKSPVFDYFRNDLEKKSWIDCCKAAKDCCDTHKIESHMLTPPAFDSLNYSANSACPATWDGWLCWSTSKVNNIILMQCPNYIHGGKFHISLGAKATKLCQTNNTWFKVFDPSQNAYKEWSNYSQCLKIDKWCNYFAFLNKYLLITTYCWMFNEGVYLYNILIFALNVKDSIKLYLAFGWGFPLIPLVIYVGLKWSRDHLGCWIMTASLTDWVINSICIIILLINVIFLIQIIKIIVVKLKSGQQKEHLWYRQTLKAVLFLVPLFGIQILLTLYRPPLTNGFLEVYHILNSLLEGLQGFSVALILCYLNGEVINKFRTRLRKESDGANCHRSLIPGSISKIINEPIPLCT